MVQILRNKLTQAEHKVVEDLIRASYIEIVNPHEVQRLVDEGVIENVHEVKNLLSLERKYLLVIVIQGVKLWLVRMNSDAVNQTI